MSLSNSPSDSSSRGATTVAVVIAILSLTFAGFMRLNSDGWTTISLFVPNAIVLVCQLVIFIWAAFQIPGKILLPLAIVSSTLLVLGMAFQCDYGDGKGAWFVFMALFQRDLGDTGTIPNRWPLRGSPFVDLVLFIPLVFSWMIIILIPIGRKNA